MNDDDKPFNWVPLVVTAIALVSGYLIAVYFLGRALTYTRKDPFRPHVPLMLMGGLSLLWTTAAPSVWWAIALAIGTPSAILFIGAPRLYLLYSVLASFGGALIGLGISWYVRKR
jgi:hypothetical protein